MVFGGIQAFNLLSIVLFLLPGLAGVKLYLRAARRSDPFNRIDTVALSIFVSLLSFITVYVGYWLLFPPYGTFGIGHAPLVTDLRAEIRSLPEVIYVYMIVTGLAAGGGRLAGCRNLFLEYLPDDPNRRWIVPFEGIVGGDSDSSVRIVTNDGDRITGTVRDFGRDENAHDVLLENPKRLRQDPSEGWTVAEELGQTLYVDGDSVARVYFGEPWSGDESAAERYEMTQRSSGEEMKRLEQLARDNSEATRANTDERQKPRTD